MLISLNLPFRSDSKPKMWILHFLPWPNHELCGTLFQFLVGIFCGVDYALPRKYAPFQAMLIELDGSVKVLPKSDESLDIQDSDSIQPADDSSGNA